MKTPDVPVVGASTTVKFRRESLGVSLLTLDMLSFLYLFRSYYFENEIRS